MKKYAIIGANSTGKSSASHFVVYKLRAMNVLAERTVEGARVLPFERSLLDDNIFSQYWVFSRCVNDESLAYLRSDVDALICDHSPYDYFIFARIVFGDSVKGAPLFSLFERLAFEWLNTYDKIFVFSIDNAVYRCDGIRKSGDEGVRLREAFNELLFSDLKRLSSLNDKVFIIDGDIGGRAEKVFSIIRGDFDGR